jgi:hypothetical protein
MPPSRPLSLDFETALAAPVSLALFAAENRDDILTHPLALLEGAERIAAGSSFMPMPGTFTPRDDLTLAFALCWSVSLSKSRRLAVAHFIPNSGRCAIVRSERAIRPCCACLFFPKPDARPFVGYLAPPRWQTYTAGRCREPAAVRPRQQLAGPCGYRGLARYAGTDKFGGTGSATRQWTLPERFDEVRFAVNGFSNKVWQPGPCARLGIISPFCDGQALELLRNLSRAEPRLLSRPDELACIDADVLERFEQVAVLDEMAASEDGEEDASPNAIQGLHAKAFIAEVSWDTVLTVGSGNATRPALISGNNVELFASLKGKRSKVGSVDDIMGEKGLAAYPDL